LTSIVPVFHGDLPVGEIRVGPDGPSFAYAEDWLARRGAFPASVRMPLTASPVPPEIVAPWLANLLPEGAALTTAGRWLGVDPRDVVGMVGQVGRDVAGALSFGHPRPGVAPRYVAIPDEAALERIIEELPRRPFLVGEEGIAMSLAGAQEKLPVARLADGAMAVPADGMPSTHILKPDNAVRLFGSVQNEALCLVLARQAGLSAAAVTTGRAGARGYLLVTRYDREWRAGTWARLHQEDFCQALGKPPVAKYQRNQTGVPGPGVADMFAVVRRHAPGRSILRLLDAVIFNVLICNTDAHAKNYSLLLLGRTRVELAPLYDLMCAAAWDNVTKNLAQEIGGTNRGDQVTAKHWRRLAADAGTSAAATLARVAWMAELVERKVGPAMQEVRAMPAGDHAMLPVFVDSIRERCQRVRTNLAVDA
jgi:serine/threonine-protein kinase HipA